MVDGDDPPLLARTPRIRSTGVRWCSNRGDVALELEPRWLWIADVECPLDLTPDWAICLPGPSLGLEFDSRTNPFEKGGNDRDPTSKAKDNLHDVRGHMTRPKPKMMKQSLPDLSLEIKESLEQSESEAAPKWNKWTYSFDSLRTDE
ncbi:hypothetical protein CR513_23715, partial [Mucuna pruriens]